MYLWSKALWISMTCYCEILWSGCVFMIVRSGKLTMTSPYVCNTKCSVTNCPRRSSRTQFHRAELALKYPLLMNACLCVMRWLHSSTESSTSTEGAPWVDSTIVLPSFASMVTKKQWLYAVKRCEYTSLTFLMTKCELLFLKGKTAHDVGKPSRVPCLVHCDINTILQIVLLCIVI